MNIIDFDVKEYQYLQKKKKKNNNQTKVGLQ